LPALEVSEEGMNDDDELYVCVYKKHQRGHEWTSLIASLAPSVLSTLTLRSASTYFNSFTGSLSVSLICHAGFLAGGKSTKNNDTAALVLTALVADHALRRS